MDAHDVRAGQHGRGRPRRPSPSRARRRARSRPSGRVRNDLRDGPTTIGPPELAELVEPRQHLVAVRRLPWRSRGPGSTRMRSFGDAGAGGERDALAQLVEHFVDDIVIGRLLVHVARPPARVHQDDRRAVPRDDCGQLRLVAQAADVVDDRRARRRAPRRRSPPCRCRPRSARARARPAPRSPAARGAAPRPRSSGLRARPRRLAADVEQVGALLHHPHAGLDRRAPGRAAAPPSEKESGVTLMMPMTSVRSPSASAAPAGQRHRESAPGMHGGELQVKGQTSKVKVSAKPCGVTSASLAADLGVVTS